MAHRNAAEHFYPTSAKIQQRTTCNCYYFPLTELSGLTQIDVSAHEATSLHTFSGLGLCEADTEGESYVGLAAMARILQTISGCRDPKSETIRQRRWLLSARKTRDSRAIPNRTLPTRLPAPTVQLPNGEWWKSVGDVSDVIVNERLVVIKGIVKEVGERKNK